MTIDDAVIDDLFIPRAAVSPPPTTLAHITCRVCARAARVPRDHPALLCYECLRDIGATAAHVAERTAIVLARWMREYDAFQALVQGDAWWQQVADARYRDDPLFAAAWERARSGPHAAIVAAYESLVRTSDEVAVMNDWYRAAETELRAAELDAREGSA